MSVLEKEQRTKISDLSFYFKKTKNGWANETNQVDDKTNKCQSRNQWTKKSQKRKSMNPKASSSRRWMKLITPSRSSQCTSPEHLSHASNLGWWSVSPLIVYLFQCYSLRTSHPRLLPQIPKSVLYICVSFSVLHIGLGDRGDWDGEHM